MKITALTLLLGLMTTSAFAMFDSDEDYLTLIKGGYSSVLPAPELINAGATDAHVLIKHDNGELVLENRIFIGTKNVKARYKVDSYECSGPRYVHCSLRLSLVEKGVNVHFLGINPTVTIEQGFSNEVEMTVHHDFEFLFPGSLTNNRSTLIKK